ncbi:MAG TPA: DUF559 domain-containing protein [Reyranella sp.]|nr:DUF559 domain-containing protein [Reyranella sp.]
MSRDNYDSQRARELRRDGSRAERKVWEPLRDRRIADAKFRRQHPIGAYFPDFARISRKLVIEVDGEHHTFQQEADARRTAMMECEGWRVVRFWANHVVENPDGVWEEIELLLKEQPPHLASPPEGRGT